MNDYLLTLMASDLLFLNLFSHRYEYDDIVSRATHSEFWLCKFQSTTPPMEEGRRSEIEHAQNFCQFGEQEVFKKLCHKGYCWERIRYDIIKIV